MKKTILMLVLLTPFAVSAGALRYDFTGTGNGGMVGYLDFDDTGLAAGDISGNITDWSFTWNSFTIDMGNSVVVTGASQFVVDGALEYVSGQMCFGNANTSCIATNNPIAAFNASSWRMIQADVSIDSGVQSGVTLSSPSPVPTPAPATALLVGCGLVLLGLRRRRSQCEALPPH